MSVRVPDERLDIIAKRLESHTYWPWPSAVADLAALVSDLRAARAEIKRLTEERDERRGEWAAMEADLSAMEDDNQRLREALKRIAAPPAERPSTTYDWVRVRAIARAALAEEPRA